MIITMSQFTKYVNIICKEMTKEGKKSILFVKCCKDNLNFFSAQLYLIKSCLIFSNRKERTNTISYLKKASVWNTFQVKSLGGFAQKVTRGRHFIPGKVNTAKVEGQKVRTTLQNVPHKRRQGSCIEFCYNVLLFLTSISCILSV